jgi:hypothetical protein
VPAASLLLARAPSPSSPSGPASPPAHPCSAAQQRVFGPACPACAPAAAVADGRAPPVILDLESESDGGRTRARAGLPARTRKAAGPRPGRLPAAYKGRRLAPVAHACFARTLAAPLPIAAAQTLVGRRPILHGRRCPVAVVPPPWSTPEAAREGEELAAGPNARFHVP